MGGLAGRVGAVGFVGAPPPGRPPGPRAGGAAGAGPDEDPLRDGPVSDRRAGRLRRSQHARQHDGRGVVAVAVAAGDATRAAERPLEDLEVVRLVAGAPVRGAAGVAAVGDELVEVGSQGRGGVGPVPEEPPGQPVVRQRDRGDARRGLGLGVAQPAQLGGREGGDGHRARPSRPLLGPELGGQVASRPGAAGVVPEQGVAHDRAVGVEHDHPVLLPGDRDRGDVVEAAGRVDRLDQGVPPGVGRHLGALRVPGGALAHQFSGDGVADHDLATLGRGVDPGDETHGRSLSYRATNS